MGIYVGIYWHGLSAILIALDKALTSLVLAALLVVKFPPGAKHVECILYGLQLNSIIYI